MPAVFSFGTEMYDNASNNVFLVDMKSGFKMQGIEICPSCTAKLELQRIHCETERFSS